MVHEETGISNPKMSDDDLELDRLERRNVLQIAAGSLALGVFGTGTTQALADDESVETFIEEYDGAAVRFTNQESDGTTVVVDELLLGDGGYISIHDVRRRLYEKGVESDPIVESLIGVSEYLEPGYYEDVTVDLFGEYAPAVPAHDRDTDGLVESQPLLALPHRRADEDDVDEERDGDAFVVEDPAYREGARELRGFGPVNDVATVLVDGESAYSDGSAALETAEARFDFELEADDDE